MKELYVETIEDLVNAVAANVKRTPVSSVTRSDDVKTKTMGFALRVGNLESRIYTRKRTMLRLAITPLRALFCFSNGRDAIAKKLSEGANLRDLTNSCEKALLRSFK